MTDFLDEPYKLISSFIYLQKNYVILKNILTNEYCVFLFSDIKTTFSNNGGEYFIKKNYIKLNNKYDFSDNLYIIVKNNFIHNEAGPAISLYGGINYNWKENLQEEYFVCGKLMSQYSFHTWVKDTEFYPQFMSYILGKT